MAPNRANASRNISVPPVEAIAVGEVAAVVGAADVRADNSGLRAAKEKQF